MIVQVPNDGATVNAGISGTGHGAAPSALGYAYQAEAALVELVHRAKI
jgi:hypothetical protein